MPSARAAARDRSPRSRPRRLKTFPGVRALDGVDFRLKPGEIHALMGENGAGKSTLIKIITGVHLPDAGALLPRRQAGRASQPARRARRRHRRRAPGAQPHPALLGRREHPARAAADPERPRRLRRVHREARRWLDLLDRGIDPRTRSRTLSVAQMQLVEIAKALSLEARVLLLDEPTASITGHEAAALFAVLRQLRADGVAIVFVSHKLEEVFALADRVTVLRDGRNAARPSRWRDSTRQRLVSPDDRPRGARRRRRRAAGRPARWCWSCDGVATSFGHRDIDLPSSGRDPGPLRARRRRPQRAGQARSSAPRRITAGELASAAAPARIRDIHEALRRCRIGYVSEDRKGEGLILTHRSAATSRSPIWRRLAGVLGLVTAAPSAARVAAVRRSARKSARPRSAQPVGNAVRRQPAEGRVAKWLAAEAEILIVDEPTVGIDIKTKADLHELLRELADGGTSVLLISATCRRWWRSPTVSW